MNSSLKLNERNTHSPDDNPVSVSDLNVLMFSQFIQHKRKQLFETQPKTVIQLRLMPDTIKFDTSPLKTQL